MEEMEEERREGKGKKAGDDGRGKESGERRAGDGRGRKSGGRTRAEWATDEGGEGTDEGGDAGDEGRGTDGRPTTCRALFPQGLLKTERSVEWMGWSNWGEGISLRQFGWDSKSDFGEEKTEAIPN